MLLYTVRIINRFSRLTPRGVAVNKGYTRAIIDEFKSRVLEATGATLRNGRRRTGQNVPVITPISARRRAVYNLYPRFVSKFSKSFDVRKQLDPSHFAISFFCERKDASMARQLLCRKVDRVRYFAAFWGF